MSWLLGSYYKQPQPPPPGDFGGDGSQPPSAGGTGGGSASGGGGEPPKMTRSQMEAYRFDSSALERAAKAAKDLERSAHAKEALELTRLQETTKQVEAQLELKKYEASIEQIRGEERRKALAEETKQHQLRAQYQDQLARKRYDEQLQQQQRMNEENLRRQEESIAKQEALKKATIEHEMKLRHQIDMEKIKTKMEAKGKIDRENQDLTLEQIRLKAAEQRDTTLNSIKTIGSVLGAGFSDLLDNKDRVLTAVGSLSLLALGVYAAKGTTGVAMRYIEAHLSKPTLVRETSRISPLDVIRHPIQTVKKLKSRRADPLQGVILTPELEEELRDIAISTKNTKYNRAMYRNILMYGPPGTGKTMFAKRLAEHSGMDYAIVTGGDFAPLRQDGVTAIHKVFDWASTSRKGLLLFIDEADAFLRNRSSGVQMTEDLHNMLNAFLNRVGTQSNKFMLVLASNTPEYFDEAIHDRLDDMVEFTLPGRQERERLIRLYFEKFVLEPAAEGKRRLKVAQCDYGALCSKMAEITEGLSARALSKLGVAWQAAAFASTDCTLTEEMILNRCLRAVKQYRVKEQWHRANERITKGQSMVRI